uniref:Uncharacterized protein n=1 Tax=Populus trichocarpa TaxID=3694 RepID=A9PF67_POPTR|nr:unknown [Populus trichocarpa]
MVHPQLQHPGISKIIFVDLCGCPNFCSFELHTLARKPHIKSWHL